MAASLPHFGASWSAAAATAALTCTNTAVNKHLRAVHLYLHDCDIGAALNALHDSRLSRTCLRARTHKNQRIIVHTWLLLSLASAFSGGTRSRDTVSLGKPAFSANSVTTSAAACRTSAASSCAAEQAPRQMCLHDQ